MAIGDCCGFLIRIYMFSISVRNLKLWKRGERNDYDVFLCKPSIPADILVVS